MSNANYNYAGEGSFAGGTILIGQEHAGASQFNDFMENLTTFNPGQGNEIFIPQPSTQPGGVGMNFRSGLSSRVNAPSDSRSCNQEIFAIGN